MLELTHEQARRYLHIGAAELSPSAAADLAAHLAACPACRTSAARLEALRPELTAVLHARWDALRPAAGLPQKIAQRARKDNIKRQAVSYASATIGVIALVAFFFLFRFVIPRPARHLTPAPTALAVTITLTPELQSTARPSPSGISTLTPPSSCVSPSGWSPITIQAGDTLDDLAEKYNVPMEALIQANCLVTEELITGTILFVPGMPPTESSNRCGSPSDWVLYTVQPGDNLYRLSLAFGVTLAELQFANCMGNSNLIRAGQRIFVPNVATRTPTVAQHCQAVTPLVTARSIDTLAQSPRGQWIAYWVSSQEDFDRMQGWRPPARYQFTNLQTGQSCLRPELTRLDEYPPEEGIAPPRYSPVEWSEDEATVIVITEQGYFTGQPCQAKPFTQLKNYTNPHEPDNAVDTQTGPELSPDGQYRIGFIYGPLIEDNYPTITSTITSLQNGQVVVQAIFQVYTAIGGLALNGEWISSQQYLISESKDQGPLIMDVDRGVIRVMNDVLGIQDFPSPLPEGMSSPIVSALVGPEPGQYHLLVESYHENAEDIKLYLYHAENSLVENLPYHSPWYNGFSPDHQWLMMDTHPDVNGYEGHEVWIRRLEDVNGEWQLLAGRNSIEYGAIWNASFTEMVIYKGYRITWQNFPNPNQAQLGCWLTSDYLTTPLYFSPDGCSVITIGNWIRGNEDGVFNLDLCSFTQVSWPTPSPTAGVENK
jgi:LysM repeat protein